MIRLHIIATPVSCYETLSAAFRLALVDEASCHVEGAHIGVNQGGLSPRAS